MKSSPKALHARLPSRPELSLYGGWVKSGFMNLFARPHYVSDATAFIDSLKAEHPTLEAEQRQGRALLWDKSVDRELQTQAQAARVAQKPYVYQTEPLLR